MKFHETPLPDARLIELERKGDDRGFFARFYCEREFGAAGLATHFAQINNSLSAKKGTLSACGIRYDDRAFGIDWPLPVTEISLKDARWPDFCL